MTFDPHPTEDTEYAADEDRIVELHDVDGWDRNGVVDAAATSTPTPIRGCEPDRPGS